MLNTRWYVFQSRSNSEFFAERQLTQQKFGTWVPWEIIDKKRLGVTIGQQKQALFRSYGFVQFDVDFDPWRPICSTFGVKRLLSTTPEKPIPVPVGMVESLQLSMQEPLTPEQDIVPFIGDVPIINMAVLAPSVQPNDEAEVVNGTYAGHVGIVKETSKKRCKLLMDILGGQVPVTFKLMNVRKVEAA